MKWVLLSILLAGIAPGQTPVFNAPSPFAASQAPLSITSADFNGDGVPDLAVANAGPSVVSVFLGQGGGKFSAALALPLTAGCEPAYLTSGNFSGARLPDILAICPVGAIEVLPNTGNGTFGPAVTTNLPAPAWVGNLMLGSIHPAVGDFNGDGLLDLVVPTFGTSLLTARSGWYVVLSSGGGSFQAPVAFNFNGFVPMSVAAGDFNGDGNLDLAALYADNQLNVEVEFAPGNGKGGFTRSPKISVVPSTAGSLLEVADLNGDGIPDLVVAGPSLGKNLIDAIAAAGLGDGSGTVQTPGASGVTALLGDGTGYFKQSYNAVENAYTPGVSLVDLLGSGNYDLVESMIEGNVLSGATPAGALQVRPGNGDGTFGNPVTIAAWSSTVVPTDLITADFDGDGRPDIAATAIPPAPIAAFSVGADLTGLLTSILSKFPNGNAEVLLNQTPPPSSPVITAASAANGATYLSGGFVPGSWAQVKGTKLAAVSHYVWQSSDFAGLGNNLPTTLQGTSVTVNGLPAAVYYVDPSQVNFQVPAGITGNAPVQVTVNGKSSNVVNAAASASSPGIFPVSVTGINYAGGVFPDGKYIGDPAVSSAFRNAAPGDQVQLFATGLTGSPAGTLVTETGLSGVTITIGNVTFPADFAGLVAVGEFQVNFTVPQQFASMPAASYPIRIAVNGVSSPATIGSNPPGPVVIPIRP